MYKVERPTLVEIVIEVIFV